MNATFAQKKKLSEYEIASYLEREIVENALLPGVRLPTSGQLARQCGVSAKTADRAIVRLVERGLIARVRGKGSFVRNNRGAVARPRVALFYWKKPPEIAELAQAAFGEFSDQLIRELREHGFELECFEENTFDKQNSRIHKIEFAKYDVLLAAAGILETADALLRRAAVPVILFDDDVVHSGPWHQVVFDYRPGFRKALEYCVSRGFRKFFIAGYGGATSDHRVAAVLAEAELLGIRREAIYVYNGKCRIITAPIMAGSDCADHYLKNGLFDHVILSISDIVSFGMLEMFAQSGLLPGRDFRLISYDNLESKSADGRLAHGITGITHPQQAEANAIISMIENLTRAPCSGEFYQTYFVPAREFIVRQTLT